MRISCKGPLSAALYVYCDLENYFFLFFKQHPVIVYILMSVLSTSQHGCHWLSRCLCKHFTIWRRTQNIVKNIIGNVASSYQVNQAIEIPYIAENCINSHVFTCSAMLIRCWKVFWLARYFFYSGGLGANRNVSGKLDMKLAILSSFCGVVLGALSSLVIILLMNRELVALL